MSDNIMLLHFNRGAALQRVFRVIKTRGGSPDHRENVFEISDKCVSINNAPEVL